MSNEIETVLKTSCIYQGRSQWGGYGGQNFPYWPKYCGYFYQNSNKMTLVQVFANPLHRPFLTTPLTSIGWWILLFNISSKWILIINLNFMVWKSCTCIYYCQTCYSKGIQRALMAALKFVADYCLFWWSVCLLFSLHQNLRLCWCKTAISIGWEEFEITT